MLHCVFLRYNLPEYLGSKTCDEKSSVNWLNFRTVGTWVNQSNQALENSWCKWFLSALGEENVDPIVGRVESIGGKDSGGSVRIDPVADAGRAGRGSKWSIDPGRHEI